MSDWAYADTRYFWGYTRNGPCQGVSSTAPNSAQSGVGDTFPDRIITTGLRGTPDWISARAVDESETEK